MAKFSKISLKRLHECDPRIVFLFSLAIKNGPDFSVRCGHRSLEDQLAAYNAGNSQIIKGKHNEIPSLAIDVDPYPIDFNNFERYYQLGHYIMGIAHAYSIPLRWGSDWDQDWTLVVNDPDETFNDPGHFELNA